MWLRRATIILRASAAATARTLQATPTAARSDLRPLTAPRFRLLPSTDKRRLSSRQTKMKTKSRSSPSLRMQTATNTTSWTDFIRLRARAKVRRSTTNTLSWAAWAERPTTLQKSEENFRTKQVMTERLLLSSAVTIRSQKKCKTQWTTARTQSSSTTTCRAR